jgi:hypothetical protein
LSARFSTTPELRLRIGRSRLRRALFGALLALQGCGIWLLWDAGHRLVALSSIPVLLLVFAALVRDPARGTIVQWRDGSWTLEKAGERLPVVILPATTCLPWVVYLAWRSQGTGGHGHLWLFSDSTGRDGFRCVRARLALE